MCFSITKMHAGVEGCWFQKQITCAVVGEKWIKKNDTIVCLIAYEKRGNRRERLVDECTEAICLFSRDHPRLTFKCWATGCEGAVCGWGHEAVLCSQLIWSQKKVCGSAHSAFGAALKRLSENTDRLCNYPETSCHHFSLPPDCRCYAPLDN